MIKSKGVCDVCTKEFELNGGSFGVKAVTHQHGEDTVAKTIIEIFHKVVDAPSDYQHVCGKACLYRLLDGVIDIPTKQEETL